MNKVFVNLGASSYEIFIGENILLRDEQNFREFFRDKFADVRQNVRADKNFITRRAEIDKNFFHVLNS